MFTKKEIFQEQNRFLQDLQKENLSTLWHQRFKTTLYFNSQKNKKIYIFWIYFQKNISLRKILKSK